MSDNVKNSEPRGPFPWLLWWMIDGKALRKQVRSYATLPVYASSRGQGALLLVLSAVISLAIIVLVSHALLDLIDVGLLLVLAFFIFRGQRWAMIGAMILWTFEKIIQLVGAVHTHQYVTPFTVVIWWTVYMHAFYFAYRVETYRRNNPEDVLATFD